MYRITLLISLVAVFIRPSRFFCVCFFVHGSVFLLSVLRPAGRSRRCLQAVNCRYPDKSRWSSEDSHVCRKASMRPSSSTRILSADSTLETRWAMMILVVPGIFFANAARMLASVEVSTALVESSRIRTFGFFQEGPSLYRDAASVRRIHWSRPVRSWSGNRRASCR